MLNCIPQSLSPGRSRKWNLRILDPQEEEDEAVKEFQRLNPYDLEALKAEEMENILGNALSLAERNHGSIISLQKTTPNNVIEFGRRISSLRSLEDMTAIRGRLDIEDEEMKTPDIDDNNEDNSFTFSSVFRSPVAFNNARSLPTFLKVEKGNPALLTQKSWETIMTNNEDEDVADEDSLKFENPNTKDKNETTIPKTTPARSWNKLRKTLDEEAKEESNGPRCFTGFGSSLHKIRSSRNNNVISAANELEFARNTSFAKDLPVEVALHPEKEKKKTSRRSWGAGLRKGKKMKDVSKDEEEQDEMKSNVSVNSADLDKTPTENAVERSLNLSTENEEVEQEDFFVNDNNPTKLEPEPMQVVEKTTAPTNNDASMSDCFWAAAAAITVTNLIEAEEGEIKQAQDDSSDISMEESQSMEIICGSNGSSAVDIIGPTSFLKGDSTSWGDVPVEAFDIIPRRR